MQQPAIRSYLYVPGSNPAMMEKALHSEADALVLDLEDAVAFSRKAEARQYVSRFLQQVQATKSLFVRINAVTSGLAQLDVEAIAHPTLAGVRMPKVETPDEVRQVASWLQRAGSQACIQCSIESALGVEQAFVIASADERVIALGLGEADLAADLGISDDAGFAYARSHIVVAARAAHLAAPVQSVYTNLRDLAGLKQTTEAGKRMGFFGRSAIHPSQLAIINETFLPTDAEIADAQQLLDKLAGAVAMGNGALALEDGRFVDAAVVGSARRILALTRYKQEGTSHS